MLDQVLTTRNVTFDEQLFYTPHDAQSALSKTETELLVPELRTELPEQLYILELLGVAEKPNTSSPPGPTELQTESAPSGVRKESRGNPALLTPEGTPAPEGGEDSPQKSQEDPYQTADEGEEDSFRLEESNGRLGREQRTPQSPRELDSSIGDTIVVRTDTPPPEQQNTPETVPETLPEQQPEHRIHPDQIPDPPERPSAAPPTRQSRRRRGEAPEFEVPLFSAVLEAPESRSQRISPLFSFLPDQQRAFDRRDRAFPTLHAVFNAAVQRRERDEERKTHVSELLVPPPRHWKELEKHPKKALFYKAAVTELENLQRKGTWQEIDKHSITGPLLPLKWVFTYKIDENQFLERAKARICVRGDLQPRNELENTYAATLAARSFRIAMALAAHRDLEILQFDVVNAFLNASLHGKPVYCELPDGFKKAGKCVIRLTGRSIGLV